MGPGILDPDEGVTGQKLPINLNPMGQRLRRPLVRLVGEGWVDPNDGYPDSVMHFKISC